MKLAEEDPLVKPVLDRFDRCKIPSIPNPVKILVPGRGYDLSLLSDPSDIDIAGKLKANTPCVGGNSSR